MGCHSGPVTRTTTSTAWTPADVSITEKVDRDAKVAVRTRELLASGTYKDVRSARLVAESEIAPAQPDHPANWSIEQAQREKRVAAQEKLNADLAKMKRTAW